MASPTFTPLPFGFSVGEGETEGLGPGGALLVVEALRVDVVVEGASDVIVELLVLPPALDVKEGASDVDTITTLLLSISLEREDVDTDIEVANEAL